MGRTAGGTAGPSSVRRYKIGDLPDIKIKYRDIIDPLIALAFHDEEIASELLNVVIFEIYKDEESEDNRQQLRSSLARLLDGSVHCSYGFIQAVQRLMIKLC